MKLLRLLPALLLLMSLTGAPMPATAAEPGAGGIWLLDLKGVLGPASADYLSRGIEAAATADAKAIIIRIDTPGGLDLSMRDLVRSILASPVPVIGYVTPGGARAASAGTYILYACHVAAMSPATNLGAATPVQIAAPSLPSPQPEQPDEDSQQEGSPATSQPQGSAMERKLINDAVAYIRGLAELRARNGDWAEQAVREGASLSSRRALELKVIDLIATDLDDLLSRLEGREIRIAGQVLTLSLAGAARIEHQPDWRSEFLAVITNPNVAYVLMLLGIYGLIFEFSNPGMGLPGIVGAVCILLALYAFQVLPVSYAGLGLVILGLALMVAEAFAPSFGVLGLGGVIAFVVGSIILMDTELPAFQVALPVILALAVSSAGLLALVLGMVWRSRRQAVVSGVKALVDVTGVVEQLHDGHPLVRIRGELWQADCDEPLAPGDRVRILNVRGVRLSVHKLGR
ncbi:NfeD family protein [Marinobacterium rhizophilum]|uniref:Nodulation protein NfeD n=1 Tax=Marinobacterium rhizophilum TaxID=420402 RepID=A0ABY5HMJ1_9GAMM|nr:nodulation protein NfeD [Marinobacterium rhizophilum]UTW13525.1 nodulation protein NfeD [Marinobacterium rhizophilum]